MPGPFTVTSQVAGPFAVQCQSYALGDLVPVVARQESQEVGISVPYLWVWMILLAAAAAAAIVAWLVRGKWPLVTVLLYTCWIVVLFIPVAMFLGMSLGGTGYPEPNVFVESLGEVYHSGWWFWLFCAVIVGSQALLLALPIRIAKQRPTPQRSVWSTAVGAAVFLSLIIVGIGTSAAAAVWGDEMTDELPFWAVLAFLFYNWGLWAWIFHGFARNADAPSYMRRLTKWMFRGSILELLVAVPSHIIVRQREVCCAHGLTAFGIAMGLAVMLISFGPGIYFLYAERIRSKSL